MHTEFNSLAQNDGRLGDLRSDILMIELERIHERFKNEINMFVEMQHPADSAIQAYEFEVVQVLVDDIWYDDIKPRLVKLVGFGADKPHLRGERQYRIAYNHLYDSLYFRIKKRLMGGDSA